MKQTLLVVIMLAGSTTVFAQQKTEPQDPQKFQQAKQRLLTRIDLRIESLQKAKTCIQNAQDEHALRNCRPGEPAKARK